MVSDAFWSELGEAERKLMRDIWAANIERYRTMSEKSQADARKTMQSNGVSFFDPPADQVAADRQARDRRAGRSDPRHQSCRPTSKSSS